MGSVVSPGRTLRGRSPTQHVYRSIGITISITIGTLGDARPNFVLVVPRGRTAVPSAEKSTVFTARIVTWKYGSFV